jgi:hypothetical protein
MGINQQRIKHQKLARWGKLMADFWLRFAAHHAAKAEDPTKCLPIPEKPKTPSGVTVKIFYDT